MIIFLYGPDTYRRAQKLKEVLAAYEKSHSVFSVRRFDFSARGGSSSGGENDGAFARFKDASLGQSLFDSFQLLVAENIFAVEEGERKNCAKVLKDILDEQKKVAVIVSNDAPTKEFSFLLEKPSRAQEFALLSGRRFEDFVKTEAARLGMGIKPQVLSEVCRLNAGDSWGAVRELEVLSLGGEAGSASGAPENLFVALREFKRLAPARALPMLERLMLSEDPAKLFNLLAYQAEPSTKIIFADYDAAIKSGKLDYEIAMTDYVMR